MLRQSVTLILAVALCSCLVGCKSVRQSQSDADVIANRLLDLIGDGRTDEIYDGYASPGFQGATDRQKLGRLVGFLRNKLGDPKSLNLTSSNWFANGTTVRGTYVYQVRWKKGDGTLKLGTTTAGGKTMMDTFYVNSDALLDIPTSQPATKP